VKVTPRTEHEIQAESASRGPWPRGVYDAEIKSATEGQSKAGNDMITLLLNVYGPDGTMRQMQDWLVDAMAHKVRHCAEAAGQLTAYDAGELQAYSLEGQAVKVKVGIDTKGERPRNKIDDYVPGIASIVPPARKPVARPMASASSGGARDLDDEIPFAPCWQ
jgi:hypothetical protein